MAVAYIIRLMRNFAMQNWAFSVVLKSAVPALVIYYYKWFRGIELHWTLSCAVNAHNWLSIDEHCISRSIRL